MKSRLMILEIFGLILLFVHMHGQYKDMPVQQQNGITLTGCLQYDMSMCTDRDLFADSVIVKQTIVNRRYSPLVAGLYSAVLPGAGQFYTKNYWQSAAFFGGEVLAWVVYAVYYNKGNQKTNDFQNFANLHWSVVTYATWVNVNFGQTININPDQSLKPWQRVSWSDLNAAENLIAQGPNQPTGFTHDLAPYGYQQYYEMIGKYSQFGGGWDDATIFQPGGYTPADVIANNGIGNVSPEMIAYSHMRGDANSFYNIATTVSYVIVANHIFSALEAALNASRINHRIQLEGHIESRTIYGNLIEFVPTLNVKYEL